MVGFNALHCTLWQYTETSVNISEMTCSGDLQVSLELQQRWQVMMCGLLGTVDVMGET